VGYRSRQQRPRSCARTVHFRLDTRARERRSSRLDRKTGAATAALDAAGQALWEALRAWRLEEARRQEVPPYVIFHDSTLTEVARSRPVTLTALARIAGIGRSKLERYGNAVAEIVSQHFSSSPAEAGSTPAPKEALGEGKASS
jgi:ATP-dependent DNA helicase RecQ